MKHTRRRVVGFGLALMGLATGILGAGAIGWKAFAQSHQPGSTDHDSDHEGGRRRYRGGRSQGGGGRHLDRGQRPQRSDRGGHHTVEDTVFRHDPPDDDLSDLPDHHTDHTNEGHEHPEGGGVPRGPMYRGG